MSEAPRPRAGPPVTEDALVSRLLESLADAGESLLAPGSDCGAVEVEGGAVVATSDVLVEGVHFDLDEVPPEAVGAKALLVNLSDLAAAAALPLGFEVGLVLPPDRAGPLAEAVARGLADAGRAHACPCLGGDTNVAPGPLVVAVTVLGRPGPGGIVTRVGARVGDRLSVTGPLGGSRRDRHLRPTPRLREAQVLARAGIAHAMMDVSDGLALDVVRLARASDVGIRLHGAAVPVHEDARTAADGRSPLEHALEDGEDFELLVAHAPLGAGERARLEAEGVTLHAVGEVVARRRGIRLVVGAATLPLAPGGYDHLARGAAAGAG